MTPVWFKDLTPYTYYAWGQEKACPRITLNVGWLENGQTFAVGPVPSAVLHRIKLLVDHGSARAMRGMHYCDICDPPIDDDADAYARSCAEIVVVGENGVRYAAPALVWHYISKHQYQPPPTFVDAVMRADPLSWEEAQAKDLCLSCGTVMQRVDTRAGWRGKDMTPVMSIDLWCVGCETNYSRVFPDASEAPIVGVGSYVALPYDESE